MAWTDEKRKAVIEAYTDTMKNEYDTDEARAAATTEVCAELAEIHGESTNGVITILNKAKVYIKKSAVRKPAATKEGGTTTRVNKAEALQELTNLIKTIDPEGVDEEIISKLTGKAALYFAGVIQKTITE
jgi:hypothetical protein